MCESLSAELKFTGNCRWNWAITLVRGGFNIFQWWSNRGKDSSGSLRPWHQSLQGIDRIWGRLVTLKWWPWDTLGRLTVFISGMFVGIGECYTAGGWYSWYSIITYHHLSLVTPGIRRARLFSPMVLIAADSHRSWSHFTPGKIWFATSVLPDRGEPEPGQQLRGVWHRGSQEFGERHLLQGSWVMISTFQQVFKYV